MEKERARGIPFTGGGSEDALRGGGRLGIIDSLFFSFSFYFMSTTERRRRGGEEATSRRGP